MNPTRLIVRRDFEGVPGGWHYTVSGTGVTISANFAYVVKRKVLEHMRANSIPVPEDFDEEFEDALCRESGHGRPHCSPAKPKPVAGALPFLTWHKVGKFLKAAKEIILKRRIVDRAESVRRVAICQGVKNDDGTYAVEPCQLASYIGGCGTCSGIAGLVKWAAGEQHRAKLDIDPDKQHCLACGCFVGIMSICQNKALDQIYTELPMYWSGCWRWDKED